MEVKDAGPYRAVYKIAGISARTGLNIMFYS